MSSKSSETQKTYFKLEPLNFHMISKSNCKVDESVYMFFFWTQIKKKFLPLRSSASRKISDFNGSVDDRPQEVLNRFITVPEYFFVTSLTLNQIEKKSTPWSDNSRKINTRMSTTRRMKLWWWARRINIYSPWHPDAIYSQILHQHPFWVVYPSHFSWRWSAENLERIQTTTNQD
jgi:hypothetical protein